MTTSPKLDSSAKIEALRKDFEDDGIMLPENIQFMFDYISALEVALEYSAGAGLTQAESDAADDAEINYGLSSYVEEALDESNTLSADKKDKGE